MLERPSTDELNKAAGELGLTMSSADSVSFLGLMEGLFEAYDRVDAMKEPLPSPRYSRGPVTVQPADNPFNAWASRALIKGAETGKLAGKTVAIKDNTCVAGLPMQNGSTILADYMPEIDATVVTRLLDAGADIHGKATCEYYCASGGSHTSAGGPVENPIVPGHNAGGSSSGSAALVAAGLVDMATGGDQGGSIRIPASFCGIVGMKPTHGLVPYTGIFQVEATIDHVGPMTATVADNALMLEVLSGPDGIDPRQVGAKPEAYTQSLEKGASGLKIGVLVEGFGQPGHEAEVDARIHDVAEKLSRAGAEVENVSIPMHLDGPAIWTPIFLEGATELMMHQNAYGTNMKGAFVESMLDAHVQWKSRADELSETLKLGILMGHYMSSRHQGRFYGIAQNLNRKLTAVFDQSFAKYDCLLMPTTPMATHPLPGKDASREEIVGRAFSMLANLCGFNATGHPSISVPAGKTSDGRPIGAMLAGRKYDESTLYQAAAVIEQMTFEVTAAA